MSEIPGLLAIKDTTEPDGSCRITFEIEDARVADFYEAFGLSCGDEMGFRSILVTALEQYLESRGVLNDKSTV